MAFAIPCTLKAFEVRSVTHGVSKKGNKFYTIKAESPDGRDCEISCTNEQLFPCCENLARTAIYNFDVRAVATSGFDGRPARSFLTLLDEPLLVEGAVR